MKSRRRRCQSFVLTGGDPLKRPDTFELVQYASDHGVPFPYPSATPLIAVENILQLKQGGLARLAVPLDADSRNL